MKIIISILLTSLFLSCNTDQSKKADTNEKTSQKDNSKDDANAALSGISDLKFDIEVDPGQTSYKGEIVKSASWNDARGKNIIIISQKPQYFWQEENPSMGKFCEDPESQSEVCEIFAFHYIWSDKENKWKKFWAINDFLFGCCDVYMDYQNESLRIEDTDKDGMAESSFFYTIGEGTMSIDRYYRAKLIYHPDNTKLKIEGTTGAGKESIESAEGTVKPVALKFEGFTGENEKWKSNAEIYWNECHQRQLISDENIISE